MSSKQHRQKRRRIKKTEETPNDDNNIEVDTIDDNNIDADLNKLIVTNNKTSYDPKYIDLANDNTRCNEGSLFRNCAMAITGQTTIEPLKKNVDNTNNNIEDNLTTKQNETPIPDNDNINEDKSSASIPPKMRLSGGNEYYDNNEQNFMPFDGVALNNNNNVILSVPITKHCRHFNKKAFRICYIIIIICIILSIGSLYVINSITKYKEQREKQFTPTEQNDITHNQPMNIQNMPYENIQNNYNLNGGDFNDINLNERIVEDLNNNVEKTKPIKLRDKRGRFVKQNIEDGVL